MTSTASAEIRVDLPRAKVWEGLRDLTRAQNYVGGVLRIEVNTPAREGVGANRHIIMKKGAPVDETAEIWTEGRGYRLRVSANGKSPAPFAEAWIEYDIRESGPEETILRMSLIYTLMFGVVGSALDLLAFRAIARKQMQGLCKGFKRHYETGAVMNADLEKAA